jgi:hypothetical protein
MSQNVYTVTHDDTPKVYESAKDALEPFMTTSGSWKVRQDRFFLPVIPSNEASILLILEAEGYLEFNTGRSRINKVPFVPTRGAS